MSKRGKTWDLFKKLESNRVSQEPVKIVEKGVISNGSDIHEPNSIIKLASKGKVSQLADLCNANPDRLYSVDVKGANILHHAAAAQQISIMDFVLGTPGGSKLLSQTDDYNTTPLHWAVQSNSEKSVDYLLKNGADPEEVNNTGHTAMHLAIQKNSLKALRALLDNKVNCDSKGNAGVAPLHVAALSDNAEAFNMLLDAGAKPCLPCSQGYRPLHTAAIAGSREVMRTLLEHGEKYGYTRERLLSYGDKEHSSPLHCAVTGGNMCSIRLCLEYGARIDVRQADDSTPMHMVCAQGNLEVVKLMFEMAPEQAKTSLTLLDNRDHSPLHKAAMYNHPSVIQFLVDKNSNMELLDTDQRTPLLLAASRESWTSVRVLIQLGANFMVKDRDERNMMHLVVLKGGDICCLTDKRKYNVELQSTCETLYSKQEVFELLNKADIFGCTPLHYACQEGNLASLRALMNLGVSARLKSWKNQSPIHFASMHGRFNACVQLLNSEQGPNIINDKDEKGMTPLHFASMNGHLKVVQLLLNRGAIIHRNSRGETPLHVAAANGYTKTIRILVEMHCQLIDLVEENGNTALHHAANFGHVNAVQLLIDLKATFLRNNSGSTCFTEAIVNQNQDVAMCIVKHDRWEEAMRTFEKIDNNITHPMMLLIQHLPEVCVAVLNRCKETSDEDIKSPNYWERYHFKYLQPPIETAVALKRKLKNENRAPKKSKKESAEDQSDLILNGNRPMQLPALNAMVEFNRVECLRHPVSVTYLRQKWQSYGKIFHGINLIFYMMSLFPITYIVSSVNSTKHWENGEPRVIFVNGTIVNETMVNGTAVDAPPDQYTNFQVAMMILLISVNACQIVKELVQMIQQKILYFFDAMNYVEWLLYVSSVLYVAPFLTGYPVHWQFELGAIAVFLAWFNLLVFLQKFDIAGIYVVMFMQILKTLVQVIVVFSFLLIAFALAFTVLMQGEADHAFRDPILSFLRVCSMMLGEISYVDKFLAPFVDEDPNTNHFGVMSFVFLFVFFLMVPILLMNLLIGLAVGDIAEVQSNAVLQRLAMQVHLHTVIEAKLPAVILERVDKNYVTIYRNKCGGFIHNIWQQVFKYTGVQTEYGDNLESRNDPNMDYLHAEVLKQKQRLKEVQILLEKQHDLLRLVVQKMEIHSEADNQDEGSISSREGTRHSSPSLRGVAGAKLLALRAIKPKKS